MANQDLPQGFKPYGQIKSVNEYVAAGAIYPGDMVKLDNAGKVAQCAASNASIGVALSYASGDGQKVLVADDPDQRFIGQADDGSVDVQSDLNLNYNITVSTASTLYKRSAMEVDGSTGATDSTLPIRVLQVEKSINNALGSNVDVIFVINDHQLKKGSEGI
jgi:hypothetical protein